MKINQTEFKRNLLLTQQYCDLQLDNSLENSDFILRSLNSKLEENNLFGNDIHFYTNYKKVK